MENNELYIEMAIKRLKGATGGWFLPSLREGELRLVYGLFTVIEVLASIIVGS